VKTSFQAIGAFRGAGASEGQIEELTAYTDSRFDVSALDAATSLPLPDEPFVACWERWRAEAQDRGAWAVLAAHLPQLAFPVRAGISWEDGYRAATLRGVPVEEILEATGLEVPRPETVELSLHASPAGRIPVLICRGREEFTALVRALARRNEPEEVPDSMGALMISGYNNWTRLGELRRRWEATEPEERETATWGAEMKRLQQGHKELYQDRVILLTDGPYSAVAAAEMGLPETEWRRRSLLLRRDHECAHYFTRRLFGSMRANLHDELLADYAGLVAAFGRFEAARFLRLLGFDPQLDRDPDGDPEANVAPGSDGHGGGAAVERMLLPGARAAIYRGKPPITDGAFAVVLRLVRRAAVQVEAFDATLPRERSLADRAHALTALASLRLEALAAPDGAERLTAARAEVRRRLG
jgi:hypothetical protein